MDPKILITNSPEETSKLAACVSGFVRGGDVMILAGDLAAGKTHFVTSFVSALGSEASVSSPTYTIAHHYKTDQYPVLHIDAYRLSGANEFRDLTLEDYYEKSALLIEWGDIIEGVFSEFIRIEFQFGDETDNQRHIVISSQGQRWQADFEKLKSAVSEVCP